MELYIFYCANWYNVIFFMKKMLYSKIISLENIYFEVCKIYYMKDKEHDIYSFFSNIRIFLKKIYYSTLSEKYFAINESFCTYYSIVYLEFLWVVCKFFSDFFWITEYLYVFM